MKFLKYLLIIVILIPLSTNIKGMAKKIDLSKSKFAKNTLQVTYKGNEQANIGIYKKGWKKIPIKTAETLKNYLLIFTLKQNIPKTINIFDNNDIDMITINPAPLGHNSIYLDDQDFNYFKPGNKINIFYNPIPGAGQEEIMIEESK